MTEIDLREHYAGYKQSLQSANGKTQEELDKTLITLCTVIIGVILTIRQQIYASDPDIGFPFMLWLAIGLLLLCILTVLVSHFLSLWVNQGIIDAIDNNEDLEGPFLKTNLVKRANFLSAGLFFLGLLAAILFAYLASSGTIHS